MVSLVSSAMSQVVVPEPLVQPLVPEGQVHVTTLDPDPSVADNTTAESSGNAAEHALLGQLMPVGALVTLPLPATTTVSTASLHVGVPTPAAETNAVPNM